MKSLDLALLNCSKIIAVIGHQREILKKNLEQYQDIEFAIQDQQKGTAHAVKNCCNAASISPSAPATVTGPSVQPITHVTVTTADALFQCC